MFILFVVFGLYLGITVFWFRCVCLLNVLFACLRVALRFCGVVLILLVCFGVCFCGCVVMFSCLFWIWVLSLLFSGTVGVVAGQSNFGYFVCLFLKLVWVDGLGVLFLI